MNQFISVLCAKTLQRLSFLAGIKAKVLDDLALCLLSEIYLCLPHSYHSDLTVNSWTCQTCSPSGHCFLLFLPGTLLSQIFTVLTPTLHFSAQRDLHCHFLSPFLAFKKQQHTFRTMYSFVCWSPVVKMMWAPEWREGCIPGPTNSARQRKRSWIDMCWTS